MFNKKIFIKDNVQLKFLFNIYYLITLLIVLSVLTSLIFSKNLYNKINIDFKHQTDLEKDIIEFNEELYSVTLSDSNHSNIDFNIESVKETKIIPNVLVVKLPKDLKNIKSIKNRKEIFIKIALPLIINENEKLTFLNNKIKSKKERFNLISRKDALWIRNLMDEYQAYKLDNLLVKVDAIPASLALAQAVIESGWGTSRFAYEGNALFGQYVWDKSSEGIIPNERGDGAKYKIKTFKSLKESVASYMKNLNTNSHYSEFRINRFVKRSNNLSISGVELAEYLYNYSIEDDYPHKVMNIILTNGFEEFESVSIDRLRLVPSVDVI